MSTAALPRLTPGSIVRIDTRDGDVYIGEVVEAYGHTVVLDNFAAWYDGDSAPTQHGPGLEVQLRLCPKTRVEVQG